MNYISSAILVGKLLLLSSLCLWLYNLGAENERDRCKYELAQRDLKDSNAREEKEKMYRESNNLLKSQVSAIEQQLLERDEALEASLASNKSSNTNSMRVIYKRTGDCKRVPSPTSPSKDRPIPTLPTDWQLWTRAANDLTEMAGRADKLSEQLTASQHYIEALQNVQVRIQH